MSRKQRAVKILTLRNRGWTIRQIAKHLGIGKSTVSFLLSELRNGTLVKKHKKPSVIITPEIKQRILVLYNEGKSTTEIGKIVGCHQVTASAITRKARRAGIVGESPRWPFKITKVQHNRILELRAEGKTCTQIRLFTGFSQSVVSRVLAMPPVKVETTKTKHPTLRDVTSILKSTKSENDALAQLKKLLVAAWLADRYRAGRPARRCFATHSTCSDDMSSAPRNSKKP